MVAGIHPVHFLHRKKLDRVKGSALQAAKVSTALHDTAIITCFRHWEPEKKYLATL